MRTHARSTRAFLVVSATAVATALASTAFGWNGGLAAFFGFLVLGTIATIPGDLEPGEYDLFGLGVAAAVILLGLAAIAFHPKPHIRYTGDMDICGKTGCEDMR